EVFDEVTLEGRFGIDAVAPRRTDPAAALADPRHDARAGGRDPRGPLHIRSQNAPTPGRNLPARLDTRLGAVPRHPASEAPRHVLPCPAREPPAGGRAVPWRLSPRQRDHDCGGSETHRLDLGEARGPRPRPGALPRRPLRAHPGTTTIRSGRARSMRLCSPSTRGWPPCLPWR